MEKKDKIYRSRSEIMINNFLGGIAWGVGSVLGATIVISLIGLILAQFSSVPLIGNVVDFFTQLMEK
jgi:hypothetical protein